MQNYTNSTECKQNQTLVIVMKFLLIVGIIVYLVACQSPTKQHSVDNNGQLIWQDEFEGNGMPDTTKWSYDVGGHGWGNQELQYYTRAQPKNVRIENGRLIIEAHKENIGNNAYTSAKLISKGKGDFTYGQVEVRAKLPKGRGTWPAIWMLASKTPLQWPDDGEIDIMEHVGYRQGFIHGTVHTQAYNHIKGTQRGDTIYIPDCSENFHVYKINWTPEKIDWFVDDKKYFTFYNEKKSNQEWPFDKPFYLILNVAIGGSWGGAQGVDDSIFPQRMEIDWVRVYAHRK
ncbi:MAG: glycoside hydrolase family 16 protein [Bernardetiaceae bacterium]|nr:glycoside hydrolase family 16 protein [Bernardetiaceae bacterium]